MYAIVVGLCLIIDLFLFFVILKTDHGSVSVQNLRLRRAGESNKPSTIRSGSLRKAMTHLTHEFLDLKKHWWFAGCLLLCHNELMKDTVHLIILIILNMFVSTSI